MRNLPYCTMTEYTNAREQYHHRLENYINNVVALKMLIDYRPRELCQCLKLYNLRGRFIHERKCVVGLCLQAWKKAEELLNLVSGVFVIRKGVPISWKLKARPKIEEDKERMLGHLEDFRLAMEYFCEASQVFFDEHPEAFYSPTIEHRNELLMLDSIPLDLYVCIANDQFYWEAIAEDMKE